jgi:hypothetical protein
MYDESGVPLLAWGALVGGDRGWKGDGEARFGRLRSLVPRSVSIKTLFHSSCRLLHLATLRPLGVRCGRQVSGTKRVLVTSLNFAFSAVLLFILVSISDALLHPSYSNPPSHYGALAKEVRGSSAPGRGNPRNEQVLIASNIIQAHLIRESWGPSLIRLVEILGPDNVYVSIYENDSGPSTKEALYDLRARIPCTSPDHAMGTHY